MVFRSLKVTIGISAFSRPRAARIFPKAAASSGEPTP
jgi:hypothetical protein